MRLELHSSLPGTGTSGTDMTGAEMTDPEQTATTAPTAPEPIVFRWRIHEGRIALRRRHLRSLEPLCLPEPLMGWIHERLEWAVDNMLASDSEGVLVLNVDPAREVKVSLEELRETPVLGNGSLLVKDGLIAGVVFEGETMAGTVWLEYEGKLHASCEKLVSATETLARDLAKTLGFPLITQPQPIEAIEGSSIFLISDEFGLIMIRDQPEGTAPATTKLQECFSRLW